MTVELKQPTIEEWEKAVKAAAHSAIDELQDACFVCEALESLFLPPYPMPRHAPDHVDQVKQWELVREGFEITTSGVQLDFEIDMAREVVKLLVQQKREPKIKIGRGRASLVRRRVRGY